MRVLFDTHLGPRGTGYIPAGDDPTDRPFRLTLAPSSLPDESPDWPLSPRTTDQGRLGSCSGNASADSQEDLDRQRGLDVEWSRLWNYLGGRLTMKGLTVADYAASPAAVRAKVSEDSGASIRSVVTFLNKEGAISEALWPYDVTRFADLPDSWTRAQARRHRLLTMRYLESAEEVRVAIHQRQPIFLGFLVYNEFAQVGQDGLYRRTTAQPVSAHAVRAVKHVASKVVPGFKPGAALIRNSWGAAWGCSHPTMASSIPGRGFFWLPDEVIDTPDVFDLWALVED